MGFLTAHTPEELRYALSWAINAPDGSGVLQTFGSYVPIARPQECMFTGSHIDIYRSVGIEAISLYYSAIPFNAIGSFISELEARKRYNPLTLKTLQQEHRLGLFLRSIRAIWLSIISAPPACSKQFELSSCMKLLVVRTA